ncbi:MAG: hypothetical protein A4E43_01045 [Methanosaeta sp. PtaB.Bin005]|nr:MAG: hypothetical protein A4E43_01045 [Methanosaeta sp. PtaB.Bin005]
MIRAAPFLQIRDHLALFEALPVDPSVPADLHLHPLGEGINHGDAHPMQSAGDAIRLVVELAAGMQHR